MHSLPGRIRIRLSNQLRSLKEFNQKLKLHPGLGNIRYSDVSQTLTVELDESVITQAELLLRIALILSIEQGMKPVSISFQEEREEIDSAGYFSGFILTAALISRLIPGIRGIRPALELLASGSTAYSVLKHGLEEVREKGSFDPEVISVFYLLTAMARGKGVNAAALTWATSFGRHLVKPLPEQINLKLTKSQDEDNYEIEIDNHNQQNFLSLGLRTLPAMVFDMLTGGMVGKETLIKQIKHVSEQHHSIIEGLTDLKKGFTLKIQ